MKTYDEEKKELEKEGWLFRTIERSHPHTNQDWTEHWYKSPRMTDFGLIYPHNFNGESTIRSREIDHLVWKEYKERQSEFEKKTLAEIRDKYENTVDDKLYWLVVNKMANSYKDAFFISKDKERAIQRFEDLGGRLFNSDVSNKIGTVTLYTKGPINLSITTLKLDE